MRCSRLDCHSPNTCQQEGTFYSPVLYYKYCPLSIHPELLQSPMWKIPLTNISICSHLQPLSPLSRLLKSPNLHFSATRGSLSCVPSPLTIKCDHLTTLFVTSTRHFHLHRRSSSKLDSDVMLVGGVATQTSTLTFSKAN